ncbi:MAG: Fic family protein [Bacteroidales bacterium]|nr:Fic family protein [Bacteroidales bacterium]
MKEFIQILDKYFSLTKEHILNFEKFNNYALVHHSNSIEGSSLTEAETILLLDEKLTPHSKPLNDTYMAVDHYAALNYILDIAKSKELLSEEIIKKTSEFIMKNTGSKISSIAGDFDSSKGEYRKLTVRAGNRTFIDYKKVPDYVRKLISYINLNINKSKDFIDIYKLSFDAHFQMVSIHPFADGNGRLSRLLMNYVQHYHKLPLSVIYNQDKINYYSALENTRKKEDINIFYDFMFEQTKKHLKAQINILKNKPKIKNNKQGFMFLY